MMDRLRRARAERAAAEQRLALREEARTLAATDPALAREIGVGRPDRPEAHAAGLVDVNNVTIAGLLELPGVDDALATRIVQARARLDGFSTIYDLANAVGLDPYAVERLREHVVFLPR